MIKPRLPYVKQSGSLIDRENLKAKTEELLEITESVCSFDGCLPTCQKLPSQLNSVSTYWKFNTENYFWHAQVCLTISI